MTTDRSDSSFIPLNRERLRDDFRYQERPTEWLLDCLRAGAGDKKTARLGRLSESDWRQVLDAATRHAVTPLLYHRLKPLASSCNVPLGVLQKLRVVCVANAARNMKTLHALGEVLTALQQAGVPVIVLKGAYLAEAVYPNIALRWMVDVDLMVPSAELPRAQAVLLDMGRGHQQPEEIESYCRREKHLPQVFIRGLRIELHWTIASPAGPVRVDAAGLWDRAHPAAIAGVEVLALCPEDLLLHICLHVCYQHGLEVGLRSFCDIAETTHRFRDKMDWAQVVHSAREWGATRYVGLTLHLARSMLGAGVPDDVLERLVPGGLDQRLIETARQSVLAQTGYGPWVPLFRLRGARSIADRAKLSWRRVFLSRGEMAAIHPASRESKHLWFYYALRVRDVIRNYWSHTVRRGRLMMRSRGRDWNAALFNWLDSGKP